jgi:hypothetical protein
VTPVGTQPTAATSLGLPATTPLGNILGAGGLSGLIGSNLALGGPLAALALGGRIGGPLGGALGGGLAAAAGLGGLGLLSGLGIGAAFGPIGLGIVGAAAGIGALLGSRARGRDKRHDTAIEEDAFREIRQIQEDHARFRRQFGDAVDSINSVWGQAESQFTRPQSRGQRRFVNDIIADMRRVEDERRRRRDLLAIQAPPEFQFGGLVGTRDSGLGSRGMMAVVHPGEFVMSRPAVERLGVSLLEGLNRGSGFGARDSGEGYTMSVWVPSKDFAAKIVKEGVPVVIGKGGKASKILRG